MEKYEVLDELKKRIGEVNEEDKKKLQWVYSVVQLFSESEILKLDKLMAYLKSNVSRLDSTIIAGVEQEVKNAVSKNSRSIESEVIEQMNKRTKTVMVIFLIVIGLFAVAALVLTVLNLAYAEEFINGWGGKLATAFGTFDFALGALGFILERIDDMKKTEIRSAREEVIETGDLEKFANKTIQIQRGGKNNTQIYKSLDLGLQYQKGGRGNKQIRG